MGHGYAYIDSSVAYSGGPQPYVDSTNQAATPPGCQTLSRPIDIPPPYSEHPDPGFPPGTKPEGMYPSRSGNMG